MKRIKNAFLEGKEMSKIKRIVAVFVSAVMLMSILAVTPTLAAQNWTVKQNTSVPKAVSGGLVVSQANPSVGKTSDYEYKFVYQRDNWQDWKVVSHFSSKNRVNFKPGKAGSYEMFVDVRNKKTGRVVTTSNKFTIKPAWNLASVTASKASIKPGEAVTITPRITGDKTGVTYKYVWERNNWGAWGVINKNMTRAQNWKPSVLGNYNVYVDATDKYGNVITKTVGIKISKAPSIPSHTHSWKDHTVKVPREEKYVVREYQVKVQTGTETIYEYGWECGMCGWGGINVASGEVLHHAMKNHPNNPTGKILKIKEKVGEKPTYKTETKKEYGTRTVYDTKVDYTYCDCGARQ